MQKITGTVGFAMFMLGAGGMDSTSMLAPGILAMVGMGLLLLTAKESGIFEQKK